MADAASELRELRILVAQSAEECDRVLTETWPLKPAPLPLLGFDCEYTADRRVAVVQLADRHTAVVARIAGLKALPQALAALLASKDVIKAGTGALNDAAALRAAFGATVTALFDVSGAAAALGVTSGLLSLGSLAQDLLGVQKGQSAGGWASKVRLNEADVRYAAEDAWLGVRLAEELYSSLQRKGETLTEWCTRVAPLAAERAPVHATFLEVTQKTARRRSDAPGGGSTASGGYSGTAELISTPLARTVSTGAHRTMLDDIRRRREHADAANATIDAIMQQLREDAAKAEEEATKDDPPQPKKPRKSVGDEPQLELNIL